jgi:hypothetical protein
MLSIQLITSSYLSDDSTWIFILESLNCLEEGDFKGDREGIRTMKTLGQNMAWLLKRTAGNS